MIPKKGLVGVMRINKIICSVKIISAIFVSAFLFSSCENISNNKQTATETVEPKVETKTIDVPIFNEDSAYFYTKTQVDFGPRVPGTKAHAACADYLFKKLTSFGFQTQIQMGTVQTFDTKKFQLKNIIGEYNPDSKKRILLCAHWDTRPFADEDSVDVDKPIDGANDGASGVAALLEIARQIQKSKPDFGVDIIFFDIEDYGQPEESKFPEIKNSWCLGSQYWANNPHKPNYFADYGILLDMIGAKDATFLKEGNSRYYANTYVEKIWQSAQKLNYSKYFLNDISGRITDDHLYINAILLIPTVDIVNMTLPKQDFGPYHHRHSDNMSIIDKNTLKAVGQTVLETIYSE